MSTTTTTAFGTATLDYQPRPRRSEALGSRLTRRGRLVVLLAVLALALAAFTFIGSPAVSTGSTHHATAHQVVVEPGQTLWEIAIAVAPDRDPRDVIADIVELNSLSSSGDVRAGQPLYLPTY